MTELAIKYGVENPAKEYVNYQMDENAIKARLDESRQAHYKMLKELSENTAVPTLNFCDDLTT